MSKKWKTLGVVGLILSSILATERGWCASLFWISDGGWRMADGGIENPKSEIRNPKWKGESPSTEEVIDLPPGVFCARIEDTSSVTKKAVWYCTTSVTVVADTTFISVTPDTVPPSVMPDTSAPSVIRYQESVSVTPDTVPQVVTPDTPPPSTICHPQSIDSATADTTGVDTTFVSVTPDTSPPSAISNPQSVDDPRTTIKKLIATIRVKDHDRFQTFMDPEKQCRLSLGKYWEKASARQRKEYLNYYTPLLAAFSISGAQRYFKDIEINYGKAVVTDEGATVPTTIIYKNQREIHIDYRLTLGSDGWKAYDVLIDNESLIDDYRKQYDEFLKGRTFDDLIQVIKDLHKIHVQNRQGSE